MTPADRAELGAILRVELSRAAAQIRAEIRALLSELDEMRAAIESATGRPLPPRGASAPPSLMH